MRMPIGECLRNAGILTDEQLQHALDEQKRSGERLGSVVVRVKLATERQVAKALACQLGLDHVDLVEHPPDPAAVAIIPKDVAAKRTCIAVAMKRTVDGGDVGSAQPCACSGSRVPDRLSGQAGCCRVLGNRRGNRRLGFAQRNCLCEPRTFPV